MPLLTRRNFVRAALIGPAVFIVGCSGCNEGNGENGSEILSIPAVKEYVVELVTKAGEKIGESASTLAEALRGIWDRLLPKWEGNVKVDPDDPLRGTLHDTVIIAVVINRPDGRVDRMKATLTDPRVFRRCLDGPWEIDPSAYPPGFQAELET